MAALQVSLYVVWIVCILYFDDMENPIMTANDKTFTWGQIGVGSFDDTADWDDLKLHGTRHRASSDTEKK